MSSTALTDEQNAARASRTPGAAWAPPVAAPPFLAVRTVAIADPGPLLDLLPAQAPLSWVKEGDGLIGWGEAARLDSTGPSRFADAGQWWAAVCAQAVVVDEMAADWAGAAMGAGLALGAAPALEAAPAPQVATAAGPPVGTGLVAFGTFEFASTPWLPEGADGTNRPSSLIVPSVLIGRRGATWWLTTAEPREERNGPAAPAGPASPPIADGIEPAPPVAPRGILWSDGSCTGAQWQDAVSAALGLIAAGGAQKVVLARDRVARADAPLDPRWALRRLGALYPTCWTFAVDGLIGATPELLVSLHRGTVRSRVLAGTIARPDPAADAGALSASLRGSAKDQQEHRFSVASLVDALRPHCATLDAPDEPFVLTLPNVLHLATDIVGAALPRATSLDLAAAAHPTAAVCGVPRAEATAAIQDLEPMSRARYAGPVGWLSASGDGEWGVALRCGQIDASDPRRIRIFAGAGIVEQSVPAAELAETDAKLAPMIAALGDASTR